MSYKIEKKEDSINELFTSLIDFTHVAPNLLKATSLESFEIWVEKLEQINKRQLYFYLRDNKDKIDPRYIEAVQWKFTKRI